MDYLTNPYDISTFEGNLFEHLDDYKPRTKFDKGTDIDDSIIINSQYRPIKKYKDKNKDIVEYQVSILIARESKKSCSDMVLTITNLISDDTLNEYRMNYTDSTAIPLGISEISGAVYHVYEITAIFHTI